MQFKDKVFILAGKFKSGDKSVLTKQMIEMCGGVVKNGLTITNRVDYVVVGEDGSPSWKDNICPQAIEAKKHNEESEQSIEVISEQSLFDEMSSIGVTKELWSKAYSERLHVARESLVQMMRGIRWSYDADTKTLIIDDAVLPDFLSLIEDAEIAGYRSALIDKDQEIITTEETTVDSVRDESESDDDIEVRLREYGQEDLKEVLPWASHVYEMENVNAPNLIEVPPALFGWSKNLKSASLPVARIIRSGAFYECENLQEINIPEVIFIGNGSFAHCKSLKGRLSLAKLEYIGPIAFSGCKKLTALSTAKPSRERADGKVIQGAGYSLKAIGEAAFMDCSSLKTIGYDSSSTLVGNNAFWRCALGEKRQS